MTATSTALKEIFAAGRPLVEQWINVGTQIAALREVATEKGLDWSQVKALLKAQVQDELDGTGEGKRVKRLVERAEFASSYADMLGLAEVNEKNYFAGVDPPAPVKSGQGNNAASSAPPAPIPPQPVPQTLAAEQSEGLTPHIEPSDALSIPDFLRRAKKMEAA